MFHISATAPAQGLGWFALCLAWMGHAYHRVVRHHQLHRPEHVGMFAGSLLQVKDWEQH